MNVSRPERTCADCGVKTHDWYEVHRNKPYKQTVRVKVALCDRCFERDCRADQYKAKPIDP